MPEHPRHPDDLARLDDGELIRTAQKLVSHGPAEQETARRCLGVVVVRSRPLVRTVIAAKVPAAVVDDLESDVLVRFARKVYSGAEITNPTGLMLRMAQFVRADYLHGRREPEMPLEEWDASADDDRLERLTVEDAVEELLAPLSERQQGILCQRLIDERSSAEVGRANNTSPGNIDVIVHRSLARMRKAAS